MSELLGVISEAVESEVNRRPPHFLLLEHKPKQAGSGVPVDKDPKHNVQYINIRFNVQRDRSVTDLKGDFTDTYNLGQL